jgi:hypothetical protein
MFGVGLGPSQLRFDGAEDLALVIGGTTGTLTVPLGGTSFELRAGQVVPRALVAAAPDLVVPIPTRQDGAAFSLQFGWSFSQRFAVLADFDANGGWSDSFSHLLAGLVLRYSPASRLWLEAGPAAGDLSYGFGQSIAENVAGSGTGILVGGGVALVRKPMWMLDLQARYGTLWYEHFRATNLSVQLGIIRRRS